MSIYDELIKDLESSFKELGYNGKGIVSKKKLTSLNCMKIIGSDANNILTMEAAKAFVEKLWDDKWVISKKSVFKGILNKIMDTKPNSNGYDVRYDGGGTGCKKFIAEVKCNIPKEKSLDSNQRKGINNDIEKLFIGKGKEIVANPDFYKDYLKFLVILECDNIRDCMSRLINNNPYEKIIKFYNDSDKNNLTSDNVYVVYVTID